MSRMMRNDSGSPSWESVFLRKYSMADSKAAQLAHQELPEVERRESRGSDTEVHPPDVLRALLRLDLDQVRNRSTRKALTVTESRRR